MSSPIDRLANALRVAQDNRLDAVVNAADLRELIDLFYWCVDKESADRRIPEIMNCLRRGDDP